MSADLVVIDGREGGGQVLRSAVALSLVTGRAFRLERLRAGREPAGLRAPDQDLLRAAVIVADAQVEEGDALESENIVFRARKVVPGHYAVDVGAAGSVVLALQALALPLALAGAPSELRVRGGTHAPFAPPFSYLEDAWLPWLHALGVNVEVTLERPAFYPRGGGAILAVFGGDGMSGSLDLTLRGELGGVNIRSITGNLPFHVGERQLQQAFNLLQEAGVAAVGGTETLLSDAPGTVVQLNGQFEDGKRIVCAATGRKGESAEEMAGLACDALLWVLETEATVDAFGADQLVIPIAVAEKGGEFVAPELTDHLRATLRVTEAFLPGRVRVEETSWGVVVRAGDD